MPRLLAGLVLALGLAAAPAAPVPEAARWVPHYAVEVGTRWVYLDADGTEEEVNFVAAAETKGGVTTVRIDHVYPGGKIGPWETVTVSRDGIFQTEVGGSPYDPPVRLLSLPARAGATWGTTSVWGPDADGKRTKFTDTCRCAGEEEIEVPAGRFTAVRVETTYKDDQKEERGLTTWYAPGVGVVKMTDDHDNLVRHLVKFTPPKKK